MKWQRFTKVTLVVAVLLSGAMALPAMAQLPLQDQVPGSMLVFPIFDIASGSATRIRITNTGPMSVGLAIHTICPPSSTNGSVCQDLDTDEVLTTHETLDFSVTDGVNGNDTLTDNLFVGCTRGFIVVHAIALDASGNVVAPRQAISWNFLIGDYNVVNDSDQKYQASAIAIQSDVAKVALAPLGAVNAADANLIDLKFGTGLDYASLPSKLHSTFRSISNDNDTEIVLLYLNFVTGKTSSATVDIDYWNEEEKKFSHGAHDFKCWQKVSLAGLDGDPRFARGPLGTNLGSIKISPRNGLGVLGAVIESAHSPGIRHMFHTGSLASQTFSASGQ